MRFISLSQTQPGLPLARVAAIVRETYAAMGTAAIEVSRPSSMPLGTGPERFRAKGAVLRAQGVAGARLNAPGHSTLMLWNLQTGEPLALLEEEWMYKRRTGVSAAVVAQMLVPEGSRPVVALIGAGGIGKETAIALAGLVPMSELRIAARSAESAHRLCAELAALNVQSRACADVQEAVKDAGLIITITSASRPIVEPSWVRSGVTIISMGGGCEFGHRFWQDASIRLVDDLGYALMQGDIAAWVAAGQCTAAQIESQIDYRISDVARQRGLISRAPGESLFAVVQGATALDLAIANAFIREGLTSP